jgi:Secretion system C-terminal sorting domain
MKSFTSIILNIILFAAFPAIYAQWSNDPSTNLLISDLAGEQALSKIVSTSDGGNYITWFDKRSGNYNMYMQRLDPLGNKLWATDGLLISSNPQASFLVDYDLLADNSDNAIVVFTDTRNSGNFNVFAYKIDPDGNFLWGPDGIGLSATSDFQPAAKVTQTESGDFVFAWVVAPDAAPNRVALQKISPNGTVLWGTSPILIDSATVGFSNPDVVPGSGDSIIVVYTIVVGNFPAQTVTLGAQKMGSNGEFLWGGNGIIIQDVDRISSFHVPKVKSDLNNGAIVAWHDDRDMDNIQSAFVQRIAPDGTLYFPINGAEGSIAPGRHNFNPNIAFDPLTEETYIFWVEANSNQNQFGVFGQKFSVDGTRLWNDNGQMFKNLNTSSYSSLNAQMGSYRVYVIYLEVITGVDTKVEGFACDSDGNFLWPGSFVTLSNPTSEKLQLVSTVDIYYNCEVAWGDRRSGDQGIYAQDVNADGQLGLPVVPVELTSFTASYKSGTVNLGWSTATEINNSGFQIERSQDNKTFNKITFIPGFGTTTEVKTYNYVDEIISNGTYYYRLKQIDYDGTFEYSNIVEVEIGIPLEFSLEQNYPNPFNPSTNIKYSVPENGFVKLAIYNLIGEEVSVLVNEQKEAGFYEVTFSALNLPSGTYIYRLITDRFVATKKMVLLK